MPKMSHALRPIALSPLGLVLSAPLLAQDAPPPIEEDVPFEEAPFGEEAPDEPSQEIAPEMQEALSRIEEVIEALDEDALRQGNMWEFRLEGSRLLVATDPAQGRMRIMTPIAEAAALPEGAMERLLQANFDTALDARYAIASGLVWGTFIHPLDSLTTRDFASGILQTKTLADTFGTTFSSGALSFGGGDSNAIIDEQLQELLEQLEKRQTI